MSNLVRDSMAVDQFTKEKLKAKKEAVAAAKSKKGDEKEEVEGKEEKDEKNEKGVVKVVALKPTGGDLVADGYLMAQLCAPKGKGKGKEKTKGKAKGKATVAAVEVATDEEEN